MSVTVEDNTPVATAIIKQKTGIGLRRAVDDIFNVARDSTPMDTGDLRNRVLKQVLGLHGQAAWQVDYAQYVERGYGKGPMLKWTTGGTGPHFAEDAANEVADKGEQYFGGL